MSDSFYEEGSRLLAPHALEFVLEGGMKRALRSQNFLTLVLLDADYSNSTKVIDRLIHQIDHYEFTTPLRISVGAACYPTHAVDADALKRQGLSHPVVNWRSSPDHRAG